MLLVLDDEDFHEKQVPLSLGQNRAVATTLNTLVFLTYCPQGEPGTGSQTASSDTSLGVLVEQAPLLLRRLYERDARRSFCRSTLWLGPYSEQREEAAGRNFLAAAVVQALLNRTSGEETDAWCEEPEPSKPLICSKEFF